METETTINVLLKRIDKLEAMLKVISRQRKKYMNIKEVGDLLGVTRSRMYKLTMEHNLPFYKPTGRTLLFDREQIYGWIQQFLVPPRKTAEEIKAEADAWMGRHSLRDY